MFVRISLVTLLMFVLAWSALVRTSEGAGTGSSYRVQTGDTLWSIAASHYEGDPRQGVWAIQRENRLDGAALTPGQVLVLP
jgi:nucleoid-associated protein YgaU